MKTNKTLITILKMCIVILIVSIITNIIVRAGTLTPSASPAATSYTLTDIYTRLTTNATVTEANHVFTPSASPAASFYTLTQIYDSIPTITAANVFNGIEYLGITGTLDLACNDPTFNGTLNKVATAYDGLGDGTNRWCMTDSGDAVAGEMLSGKKAWVDGVEITGSLATQTLSDLNDTVAAGNYAATTLSTVDADLATANILSTKTIFGIAGDSNVVNTSTGTAIAGDLFNSKIAWVDGSSVTGTLDLACNDPTLFNGTDNKVATAYDGLGDGTNRWCITNTGDAVAGEMLSGKKAWVDGVEITGSLATQTLSDLNDTVAAGNYAATTLSAVDTDLTAANILSGKTIFGIAGDSNVVNTSTGTAIAGDLFNSKIAWVDGSSVAGTLDLACNDPALFNGTDNKVATAYDGAGDGTNRWCMSDSGDATVGQLPTGTIAWVDGVAITGTGTKTLSAANSTVNAGYYAATTLETVDADLAAGNINSGTVIFGVTGTLSGASLHSGQTTSYGTAPDDADDDGTAKSYTDNANDTVTDNHTGLIWQKYDQAAKTWEDALSYCDTLTLGGSSLWRLPSVVEGITMFDYACAATGGSCAYSFQNSALDWTNTGASSYLWTSTTRADGTTYAYYLNAGNGNVPTVAKTGTYLVRCVR
ncbi:MAG: DUF1566 domain-containing protein [bacterium]